MFPPINKFIEDYSDLKGYLTENLQLTLLNVVDDNFRKIFLLSCASYHEKAVTDIVIKFMNDKSCDIRVAEFARIKGIARQYHTYFIWDGNNVNNFIGLFGSDFKKRVSEEIKKSDDLTLYMKAFLEIGHERNMMVHENFLVYILEKTFDEINELNQNALKFIDYLSRCLS